MRIRPAAYRDLPAIRALLAAEGLPEDDIGAHLATLLAGTSHGKVVTAGALEPLGEACLLRSVVVAPECRGRGWGRRMTSRLLGFARRLRMRDVYLLTMTADQFFAAAGFRAAPREEAPARVRLTRQFAALCPASAVFMTLSLRTPETSSEDTTPARGKP